MQGESPKPASTPTGAVFLSYASEDGAAAERIAAALRTAGIEVWFDQSELRGGDSWDRQIRKQIHDCRLFIALISAHTESRDEGYFRREWKLAVERTADLAADVTFLLPVVIDGTSEAAARVPDEFLRVQWTRLPSVGSTTAFIERVSRLLSPGGRDRASAVRVPDRLQRKRSQHIAAVVFAAAAVTGAVYLAFDKFWISKPTTPPASPASTAAPFAPPPHSVAVLPFTNMSGDESQEYFTDGLAEEILNALSHVNSLRVTGRTSSFSFKGKGLDIPAIARRLNVGAVLEGSVRRSGATIRVTTQLNDTRTGFHIWSESYDRRLADVFEIQSEIAKSVANHLDVELSGLAVARLGLGGTQSVDALDAYLPATHIFYAAVSNADFKRSATAYEAAIAKDPQFAAAHAMRGNALAVQAVGSRDRRERAELSKQAWLSAERAVALAPEFAEAYATRGFVRTVALLDFSDGQDFAQAARLAPGSAFVQMRLAVYLSIVGQLDHAIRADLRAIELDPEFYATRNNYVEDLIGARRYPEALAAIEDARKRSSEYPEQWIEDTARTYLAMGAADRALEACSTTIGGAEPLYGCLTLAYHALGQVQASDEAYRQFVAIYGSTRVYEHAAVCSQLGRTSRALSLLQSAVDNRDPDLQWLRIDWRLDGLRNSPEYKAIERELRFPP